MKTIALALVAALIGGAALSAPSFARNDTGARAKRTQRVLIDPQLQSDPLYWTMSYVKELESDVFHRPHSYGR